MSTNRVEDFFDAKEPPPRFATKPQDDTLTHRIEKVAEFAKRNGPDFIRLIKDKQQHNPDYNFLFKGEGYDYFRWYLYALLSEFSPQKKNEMDEDAPTHPSNPIEAARNEFIEALDRLDSSKETMKACQYIFMRHVDDADALAKVMYDHVLHLEDKERQLDVAYVIDDILFKSDRDSSDREYNKVISAFECVIGEIFAKILQDDRDDHLRRRLKRFLSNWLDQGIFNRRTIEAFEKTMSDNMDIDVPEISRRRSRSQTKDRKQNPPKRGLGVLPPHISSGSKSESSSSSSDSQDHRSKSDTSYSGNKQTRRTRAAFDPPPDRYSQVEVVDAFSFPPGLIPSLVSEKQKHSFSYCPIQSADIQKINYPAFVDPNDPYLKSRSEKFYAELDEYRPGMIREQIESRKRKEEEALEDVSVDVRRRRAQRAAFAMTEESKFTSMLPDGSFAGEGSDTMYAGLGAHTATKQTEEEKAFNAYRRLRSDVYHHVIPKGPTSNSPK